MFNGIGYNILCCIVIYICIYLGQHDVQIRHSNAIKNTTRKYKHLKLLFNSTFLQYVLLKPYFRVRALSFNDSCDKKKVASNCKIQSLLSGFLVR